MVGVRGLKDGKDLRPEAGPLPVLIAGVGGMPVPVLGGEVTPGSACLHDPEDPGQQQVGLHRRATERVRRWQERSDLIPPLLGEPQGGRRQDDRSSPRRPGAIQLCSPCAVALFGARLVAPSEERPGNAAGTALRRIGQREEQATDLRDRQREEVVGPPFCLPPAARRVTSR